MPSGSENHLQFEIGHVLFIDLVGFSKLLIEEQKERLGQLTEIVLATPQVQAAPNEQLVRLPTGDGMALVFRNSSEEPARCALEIAEVLRKHPEIPVRMGIHSGPVSEVTDVSGRNNIAGAGINMAQRVMDCGDAGHILLSQRVADDLAQYRQWAPRLHDLGECEVKHGVRLHLVNLYADEIGNPALPEKLRQERDKGEAASAPRSPARSKPLLISLGIISCLLLAIVALIFAPAVLKMLAKPPVAATPAVSPAPSATPAIPEKSIAVLPFENLSEEKANAYFADGVQDEILTDLAKIADLKVISRTSVMQYRSGVARNLREIGKQLGVAHLLEGSVQRAGGKVRVNAQLIDARSDAHLWAQTYDRDLADVFAIQSEIARTIAAQLQARISPREKAAIAEAPTHDLAANALYVEAKQLQSLAAATTSMEPVQQAAGLLEKAVARDPQFALAWCLLGRVHLLLYFGGVDHTPARRELANTAIQTAARLQPESGEVQLALAAYAYHGFRDYDGARAHLEQARATLPNNSYLYALLGAIDRRQARWSEAIRNYERAVELDPLDVSLLENAAYTYRGLRHYTESDRLFERVIAIVPGNLHARIQLALTPVFERADPGPLRKLLTTILQEQPQAGKEIAEALFNCALWERDAAAAERALAEIPPEGIPTNFNFTFPREWFVAMAARTFKDPESARSAFAAARVIEEKLVQEQPDYAPAWSLLGMIDAALGRKEEAVREGQHACELLPVTKDAWIGPSYVAQLAVIYAWVGENELAIDKLEEARGGASVPYGVLKLDPRWDVLRGYPRFEKFVAGQAPN
jgi:TolB-like protein/cytochrome c-type biogenesis protein CcmH/NrfG